MVALCVVKALTQTMKEKIGYYNWNSQFAIRMGYVICSWFLAATMVADRIIHDMYMRYNVR